MEKIIKEDSHWWSWSQSTCRVDIEHPAGGLNFPYSQLLRLAFYWFEKKYQDVNV
ncbi:MAG: hypothetical protein JW953_01590 [Anaerolineae bacterium]|nr:hypothetical protein [Anaerolineae bacterium]